MARNYGAANCLDCGEAFIKTGTKQVRCKPCGVEHHRQANRANMQKRRAEAEAEKAELARTKKELTKLKANKPSFFARFKLWRTPARNEA